MTHHDDLIAAFDQWVLDPRRGSDMEVAVTVGRRGTATDRWLVVDVLYELADAARPVDARVEAALRLPPGSTYALAARVLWATQHVWDVRAERLAG